MTETDNNPLRRIPAVDALLRDPAFRAVAGDAPPTVAADVVRAGVDAVRVELRGRAGDDVSDEELRARVIEVAVACLQRTLGPYYRRAVNATGIVLHTGLGRAVLAQRAVDQLADELSGYSVLQVDEETGERSRRDARIEWLLRRLTGAEAATVVNNNAAATMIVLNTLAAGREVIVSRGQLVEIGGSFRLPEVMAASGARMVEVGTTNKTHLRDYERAVTERTAAILRVHPSNYRIVGFSAEVPLADLERLAHARGLALIDDVGAGPLIDFSRFGFAKEPTLPESVAAGADVITSSADKLIGASQGGIILGRKPHIDAIRQSPLARILRVGKLTLAALEATLTLFLDEATALREVPTLRMLQRPLGDLAAQAERLRVEVAPRLDGVRVEVTDGCSQMGSGSLPGQDLPTRLLALACDDLNGWARRLRLGRPPVFVRIQQDRILIDPRTLLDGDEPDLIAALVATRPGA